MKRRTFPKDALPLRYGIVPKSLMRYRNVIIDADKGPEGWTFGLRNGWICVSSETHQVMESTLRECLSAFSDVEECHGDCCRK